MPLFVRPIRRPRPPLFDAQADRCSEALEVSRIDYDGFFLAVIGREPRHHLRKDALVTPSLTAIVKSLVWALFPWRVSLT